MWCHSSQVRGDDDLGLDVVGEHPARDLRRNPPGNQRTVRLFRLLHSRRPQIQLIPRELGRFDKPEFPAELALAIVDVPRAFLAERDPRAMPDEFVRQPPDSSPGVQ